VTIELVAAALVTIVGGMSVNIGATEHYTLKGFNPPPPKIDTAELPAVYAVTGSATDDEDSAGDDQVRETRTYAVRVPVMPEGQGTAQEREKRCRPILQAVKAKLRQYPHLGVAGVERARVIGDSGITLLPDWDGAFIGFEVRLQVVELIARTFAANE
jgi:hypothetical protein